MNKPVIVVPSYWRKGPFQEKDCIYDHPTDLSNPEDTISETLKSFVSIKGDFDVLVIGAPTRSSIGKEMDKAVLELIENLKLPYKVYYYGFEEYITLKEYLTSQYSSNILNLFSNRGYGNIRNQCILIPHLLQYDVAILIDDDEIITDQNFINKATEFIGKKFNDTTLGLILGFYKNKDSSIFLDETKVPWWELVWNKTEMMNRSLQIIESSNSNRLVDTPFALGGNMVIHKDCWSKVPFDPLISRGEDMDYLRNVKLLGFDAKLDKSLFIIHKPPKTQTSYLDKLKQDIFRFLYASAKLEGFGINPEDYDPYPGFFLKQTEGKALLTELLHHIFHNYEKIITARNTEEFFSKIQEMQSIFDDASKFAKKNSNFYNNFQKKWEEFMNNLQSDLHIEIVKTI
ncbi:MAG: hypothetical protein ACFFB5_04775 [Promethearchaeota archaeon]